MANVFISHRVADLDPAKRLGTELEGRGHAVWLDEWKVNVGDSIVERMNEGLADSAYLVLCYSGSGSLSPWMGREWMSALARQLNGEHVRVLPVRLTGGAPPHILADVKYVDLVADWPGGVQALCRAIR
jgi:TIR domain